MSSIKDKPLKKIVCDKRVTIDYIHLNKINNIKQNITNKNDLQSLIEELKIKIQNENDINEKIKLDNELLHLKNKNEEIKSDEHIEYYLDNGLILSDYYEGSFNFVDDNNSKNNDNKTKKSIIDYLNNPDNGDEIIYNNYNNNNNNDNNYDKLINNYMININDEYINDFNIDDINICKHCNVKLTIKFVNSEIVCDKCGYTEKICANLDGNSYKDPIRESTYFAYKRINHFNEHLSSFQAKESTDIPSDVYNNILSEVKKNKNHDFKKLNYKNVKEVLKKLKYNKYYEHIPHIISIISGEKSPTLTRENEEQLRIMFKEIQTPFHNNCPIDRKNFLSYNYVLHKFCQLLELDHLLIYFPLLKSREKLFEQEKIWKNICKELEWKYISTI